MLNGVTLFNNTSTPPSHSPLFRRLVRTTICHFSFDILHPRLFFLQIIYTSQRVSGARLYIAPFQDSQLYERRELQTRYFYLYKNMTFDMTTFSRFSEFPNELKLQIIETTIPEDIVNLSLSCKTMYDLAKRTLAHHRQDIGRWWSLAFSVKWSRKDANCLQAFHQLRNIATNRRRARHIKKLVTQRRSSERTPRQPAT